MTTLLPAGAKVHLAFGYTDMRKSIDGLTMLGACCGRIHFRPPIRVSGPDQGQPHQDRVLERNSALPVH
jgi:hypothetical protein